MHEADVVKIVHDALFVALKIASPILIMSMSVGLFVSIIQTSTSIQEQTLTLVPKLVAVFLAIAVFFSFIMATSVDYTVNVYSLIRQF